MKIKAYKTMYIILIVLLMFGKSAANKETSEFCNNSNIDRYKRHLYGITYCEDPRGQCIIMNGECRRCLAGCYFNKDIGDCQVCTAPKTNKETNILDHCKDDSWGEIERTTKFHAKEVPSSLTTVPATSSPTIKTIQKVASTTTTPATSPIYEGTPSIVTNIQDSFGTFNHRNESKVLDPNLDEPKDEEEKKGHSSDLSPWAIAVIIFGSIVAVAGSVAGSYHCYKKRDKKANDGEYGDLMSSKRKNNMKENGGEPGDSMLSENNTVSYEYLV